MSTKTLRWLGILLPVLFWATVVAMRVYLSGTLAVGLEAALELVLVAVGGAIFSKWVADRFDRHETEIEERAQQLEALRQATLALTTEVGLADVLSRVVEVSRQLSGARYAALGLLDESGVRIEQLIVAGVSERERHAIGRDPHGHGLLGAIMTERRSMRVDHVSADPRSVGFPPHHPPMTSMLGVPLLSKGQLFGNIYLTDKVNPHGSTPLPFTEQDQRTLEMFAAHAAVAIENARLHRQNQRIAIMQERERFGMNLHDGVIQSIYALGLLLDDALHRADEEPELARERIGQTIKGLNDVIRDIRSYIMDLRPQRFEGRSLEQGLTEIAGAVSNGSSLSVKVTVDTAAAASAGPQQTAELLHVTQEALTNIQKHAGANQVEVRLTRLAGQILLTIEDNGSGFDVFRTATKAGGNGLRNMQERTRALGGEFEIESQSGKGTRIVLSVPATGRSRTPAAG